MHGWGWNPLRSWFEAKWPRCNGLVMGEPYSFKQEQPVYRHILVAVSPASGESTALHAFKLARLLGSRVSLVMVIDQSPSSPPEIRCMAEQQLACLASQARLRPALRLIETNQADVAQTILRVAEETHSDLILVGSRDNRESRNALGSVAQTVAANSVIPVQVVPLGYSQPQSARWR